MEALCGPGDLLVLHSTSGRSPNSRRGRARRGRWESRRWPSSGAGGGELAALVDEAIVVPSDVTGRIQVLHLALEHLIVELVEEALPPSA